MLLSVMLYAALTILLVGLVSVCVPLRFLRIRTRRIAAMVLAAGVIVVIVTLALPARERRVATAVTELDRVMPVWQFDEGHSIRVDATPERVFEAIRATRAKDIRLFRTLTSIRRLGRSGPENILNVPEDQPILDVATRTGFVWLADETPREIVVGTAVIAPDGHAVSDEAVTRLFTPPVKKGVVIAAMNFHVTPDGNGGSTVTTATRVYASDSSTVRRFAIYWRFIRPGSGIIRVMWLRAIRERAEGD